MLCLRCARTWCAAQLADSQAVSADRRMRSGCLGASAWSAVTTSFLDVQLSLLLSNMAFLMLLRRLGRDDITAHGFRSTFRDWAAERAQFPQHVAEAALAHFIKDKTEAAYFRSDLFAQRRKLMDAWMRFAATKPASVVCLSAAR